MIHLPLFQSMHSLTENDNAGNFTDDDSESSESDDDDADDGIPAFIQVRSDQVKLLDDPLVVLVNDNSESSDSGDSDIEYEYRDSDIESGEEEIPTYIPSDSSSVGRAEKRQVNVTEIETNREASMCDNNSTEGFASRRTRSEAWAIPKSDKVSSASVTSKRSSEDGSHGERRNTWPNELFQTFQRGLLEQQEALTVFYSDGIFSSTWDDDSSSNSEGENDTSATTKPLKTSASTPEDKMRSVEEPGLPFQKAELSRDCELRHSFTFLNGATSNTCDGHNESDGEDCHPTTFQSEMKSAKSLLGIRRRSLESSPRNIRVTFSAQNEYSDASMYNVKHESEPTMHELMKIAMNSEKSMTSGEDCLSIRKSSTFMDRSSDEIGKVMYYDMSKMLELEEERAITTNNTVENHFDNDITFKAQGMAIRHSSTFMNRLSDDIEITPQCDASDDEDAEMATSILVEEGEDLQVIPGNYI